MQISIGSHSIAVRKHKEEFLACFTDRKMRQRKKGPAEGHVPQPVTEIGAELMTWLLNLFPVEFLFSCFKISVVLMRKVEVMELYSK